VRIDPESFAALNLAVAKSPRFVVQVELPTGDLFLSSHSDITGIPAGSSRDPFLRDETGVILYTEDDLPILVDNPGSAGALLLPACLMEPSVTSQKLNPDQGRAEIGAASFAAIDKAGAMTAAIQESLQFGDGLRNKTARFYLGYQGLDFSEFQLVATQIVKSASYDRGSYRVACNDIQRSTRKDVFDLATTTLASTVEAADTTINVSATAGFERVVHGTSYSDSPSSTVGYLKIKDEIIRYTGTTATSFTGCTRGVLGTIAGRYVVDGATPAARREKVAEYVYLELPGPKLAYAILTGKLYGSADTLPAKWHLAIDEALVDGDEFAAIGADLWDTADDALGMVLRFEGLTKQDGKAFLELEIMRLLGLYLPIYADGTIGLRRMTRVLADASASVTLDESNSVAVGDLDHDMDGMHNAFSVLWNWNGKEFTRTTTFLDATSASIHGEAPTMELKFKGLYGGRHTDGIIFKLLDSIRDRYSAPPIKLRVDVLHRLNVIEVGDVVRCRHATVRDYTKPDLAIDRSFEVQSVSVNHRTGAVTLDLFGSTSRASIESPTTPTVALPDAFYTAAGTDLDTLWTITSGVVSGGPYTLAGGTDLTAAGSIFYYSGDLTIPNGVTVNITGNVQLRVKGYLTINGQIIGTGGGLPGVADNAAATPVLGGNPGWVGNSRGHDGLVRIDVLLDKVRLRTNPPLLTQAKHSAFPVMQLEVVGNDLLGLPTDLRGTGGAPGGKIVQQNGKFNASGGTGGAGGAGLCTISRGLGLGADALIRLNGADTTAPTAFTAPYAGDPVDFFPGAGGAGGPGSYLLLIDGGLLSVPDLAGRFQARTGTVGVPAYTTALSGTDQEKFKRNQSPFAGYVGEPSVISALDLSFSASRIQYIPAPEMPVEDTAAPPPVSAVTITPAATGFTVSFTPGTGTRDGTVFEVWQHTASTPFSSATKVAEGATTSIFVNRAATAVVYVWVRARFRDADGITRWSTTTPAGAGVPAAIISGATYAIASPSSVTASTASSTVTTATVTASLIGASATTYAWTRISGSASISANSAATAATTFTATPVAAGETLSALFRCTIDGTYTVDVPVECTNAVGELAVTASPTSVSKSEDAATITTATVTASAVGGAGGYTYAWTKVSGGTITATSSATAATTFEAATMAAGEARSAIFRCTATDTASPAATATVDVTVTITRAAFSVSLSPSLLFKIGTTSSLATAAVTATPTGGVAPYAYSWSRVSGDVLTIGSPFSASTVFSFSSTAAEWSKSGVYRCTVTDSTGATATRDITVGIERF
jgi:hypothetical protein